MYTTVWENSAQEGTNKCTDQWTAKNIKKSYKEQKPYKDDQYIHRSIVNILIWHRTVRKMRSVVVIRDKTIKEAHSVDAAIPNSHNLPSTSPRNYRSVET
jgi:hypothetical protein